MKITFIKNNKEFNVQKIRIFLKDVVGNEIQLDLKPGEYVYSETNQITNSLRIYSRKGVIKIEQNEKPDELEYYIGYNKSLKQIISTMSKKEVAAPESPQEEINVPEPSQEEIDNSLKSDISAITKEVNEETTLDKIKEDVNEYKSEIKKYGPGRPRKDEKRLKKKKKRRGRPKKRGPKKGFKRKQK